MPIGLSGQKRLQHGNHHVKLVDLGDVFLFLPDDDAHDVFALDDYRLHFPAQDLLQFIYRLGDLIGVHLSGHFLAFFELVLQTLGVGRNGAHFFRGKIEIEVITIAFQLVHVLLTLPDGVLVEMAIIGDVLLAKRVVQHPGQRHGVADDGFDENAVAKRHQFFGFDDGVIKGAIRTGFYLSPNA